MTATTLRLCWSCEQGQHAHCSQYLGGMNAGPCQCPQGPHARRKDPEEVLRDKVAELTDEVDRLAAALAAAYVQAIDSDGESVWQDPETGMVVWTPPGYDGKATRVLEPLFRRVTEPAESVTT